MAKKLVSILTVVILTSARAHASAAEDTRRTCLLESAKNGEQWQPGLHYNVLAPRITEVFKTDGQLPRMPVYPVPAGKIGLTELSMYSNVLSRDAGPPLQKWLKGRSDVHYVRRPAIVFPHARLQARLFYTLERLGRDDLHDEAFEWILDSKRVSIYHGGDSGLAAPDQAAIRGLNAAFARTNGIDVDKFKAVYDSAEIDREVIHGEIRTHWSLATNTSTFVINGKYSTSLQRVATLAEMRDYKLDSAFERLFKLIDYLVDSERRCASQEEQR